MLVVMGLLMTGVAYACWSQTIYAGGTVKSGDLDWEFTMAITNDPGLPSVVPDYHCNDNFEGHYFWQGDKDVGYTTAVVKNPHTVQVTMNNVYPCYFVMVSLYAKNSGSVPLIIENVVIDGHVITETPTNEIIRLDLDEDGYADIEIWWGNSVGDQIEPGGYTNEMSFWFHVLQDAPQDRTLHFTISLTAVQWNGSTHWTPPDE